MTSSNVQAAKELLKQFPLLNPQTAIGQLAAMLALDWTTAAQIYNAIVGG